ncbi:MAG TPA: hypothetical protein VM899_14795 [Rubellimicrobium sp.]|jgi:hypothetical protein|nr:hypothetical protein [Rubellimicrobium sp.]
MMAGDKGSRHWRAGRTTGPLRDGRWTHGSQSPEAIGDGSPVAVIGHKAASGVARA